MCLISFSRKYLFFSSLVFNGYFPICFISFCITLWTSEYPTTIIKITRHHRDIRLRNEFRLNRARRSCCAAQIAAPIYPRHYPLYHMFACRSTQSKQWLDTAQAALINRSTAGSCININNNEAKFTLRSTLLTVSRSPSVVPARVARSRRKGKCRFAFPIRRIKRNFIRPMDRLFRYANAISGTCR